MLFINVDINEMVCSEFDTGHQSHLAIHVNRIIEKCIRESGCIDVEALCIISEEQVMFQDLFFFIYEKDVFLFFLLKLY